MKEHIQHKVDDVFSDLGEYSPALEEAQLDDFAVRLDKMRYKRFGWGHFNIYYSCAAIFCTLLVFYSLTNYMIIPEGEGKAIVRISKHNWKVGVQREIKTIIVQDNDLGNDKATSVNTTPIEGLIVPGVDTLSENVSVSKDYSNVQNVDTPSVTKPDQVAPVKIVYVRKRDTIFTFDTIRVKKKRK